MLDKMEPERLTSVFKLLSELAAPLWCYDDSRMPLPHETVKETSCLGVRDSDDTILKKHEESVAPGKVAPAYISLIDPNRITMFSIKAGIPLFALEGMEELEHAYYRWDDLSANHIDRRWKWVPDLIPMRYQTSKAKDRQLAQLCFATALAPSPLGLITKETSGFVLKPEEPRGDDPKPRMLGESILNAFLALEPKEMNDVRWRVKKVIESNDSKVVEEALKKQIEVLQRNNISSKTDFETSGFNQNLIVLLQEFSGGLDRLVQEL